MPVDKKGESNILYDIQFFMLLKWLRSGNPDRKDKTGIVDNGVKEQIKEHIKVKN